MLSCLLLPSPTVAVSFDTAEMRRDALSRFVSVLVMCRNMLRRFYTIVMTGCDRCRDVS